MQRLCCPLPLGGVHPWLPWGWGGGPAARSRSWCPEQWSLPSPPQLLQSQDVKEDAVLCCSMEVSRWRKRLRPQMPHAPHDTQLWGSPSPGRGCVNRAGGEWLPRVHMGRWPPESGHCASSVSITLRTTELSPPGRRPALSAPASTPREACGPGSPQRSPWCQCPRRQWRTLDRCVPGCGLRLCF